MTLLPPLYGQSRLSLLTGFDRPPDGTAVEWMEQEVAGLLSGTGLTLSWEEQKEHNALGATDLVAWVQFHGDCRLEPGGLFPATNGRLAATRVLDGEMQPSIEVDCDRAAAIVWQNRGTLPLPLATRTFGRALGRMVAHELCHYLTQSAAHTASEIFSRAMGPGDLMREKVRFEAREVEALREGLREKAAADHLCGPAKRPLFFIR